jgi:hypothetical protein
MAEPYVEQLNAVITRLDAATERARAHPERPCCLPDYADQALCGHLMRGVRASCRALAVPPAHDAAALAAWAIRELRAGLALLEEWDE